MLPTKHRARATTYWQQRADGRPHAYGGNGWQHGKDAADAAKDIAALQEKADKLRGSTRDVVTRMREVNDMEEQAKNLVRHLPSKQPAAGTPSARLFHLWRAAAQPKHRTARGLTEHDVRKADVENAKPLAAQHVRPLGEAVDDASTVWYRQRAPDEDGATDPFAPITDAEYEAAAARWKAAKDAGRPVGEPPLNVEQRAGARPFLEAALVRARGIQRGDSAPQIAQAVKAAGLSAVMLVVGAGGTGKSAMVHTLKRRMEESGAGYLVVTAYTGVATAPFGGPTLLALMSLGISCKGARDVKQLKPTEIATARAKFASECGVSIENVGGIVIDEVSFIAAAVFGHCDHALRALTGNLDVPCGGIPLLLCGDNHQKPPPGDCQWYRELVESLPDVAKRKRGNADATVGSFNAKACGLELLKSARKVELRRLMRAAEDVPFIDVQQRMRRTEIEQPICPVFLHGLRPLSAQDAADDAEWQFAPVGVVSRHERDVINVAQIHSFAQTFGLPLFKWKLPLVDHIHDEKLLRDLYLDEPMLWGYFAEGAPVNLTENIKPVRKLVNGSPALLDSLVLSSGSNATIARRCVEFDGNGEPLRWTRCTMADVYGTSGRFQLVELDTEPVAVNVRVGGKRSPPGQPPGSAPGSVLWHGVELDDLSELVTSVASASGDQIIPLFLSRNVKEGVELRGKVAAQAGLPIKVKVREHQYSLAFALTDFKLQGRTLAKLILLLSNRQKAPWITLAAFYVFISRVRLAASLRLVFKDDEAIKKVGKLRHDEFLQVWEKGYDADGRWDDERAKKAWTDSVDARQARQRAKKAEDDERGRKRRAEQVQKKKAAAEEAKRAKAGTAARPAPPRTAPPRLLLPAAAGTTRSVDATSAPRSAPPRLAVAVATGKRRAVDAKSAPPSAPARLPMPAAAGKQRAVEATTGGGAFGDDDARPQPLGLAPPSPFAATRRVRICDDDEAPCEPWCCAGADDDAADEPLVCHLALEGGGVGVGKSLSAVRSAWDEAADAWEPQRIAFAGPCEPRDATYERQCAVCKCVPSKRTRAIRLFKGVGRAIGKLLLLNRRIGEPSYAAASKDRADRHRSRLWFGLPTNGYSAAHCFVCSRKLTSMLHQRGREERLVSSIVHLADEERFYYGRDMPPYCFCGARCYGIFEPWRYQLEELEYDPCYDPLYWTIHEATYNCPRQLRANRLFVGVGRAVGKLLQLHRRSIERLYAPGGTGYREAEYDFYAGVAAQLMGRPVQRLRASAASDGEASDADEQPRRKRVRRVIHDSDDTTEHYQCDPFTATRRIRICGDDEEPCELWRCAGTDDEATDGEEQCYHCDHPECDGRALASQGPKTAEHPHSMGTCSGCGAWFCDDRTQHTETSTFFEFGTCAVCAAYCERCGQPDVYAGCNGSCACRDGESSEDDDVGEPMLADEPLRVGESPHSKRRRLMSPATSPAVSLSASPSPSPRLSPPSSHPPRAKRPRPPGTRPPVYPEFEFKYPFVWYHSRFAWSEAQQNENVRKMQSASSPDKAGLSVPGRDSTVLVEGIDGHLVKSFIPHMPTQDADAYLSRLFAPHAARLLQAHTRAWLVRRRVATATHSPQQAVPPAGSAPPSPLPSPPSRSTTAGWAPRPSKEHELLAQRTWTVSHAPSGRYRCRACFRKIEKGTMRIGAASMMHQGVEWYHLTCRRPPNKSEIATHAEHFGVKEASQVEGLDALGADDQAAVAKRLAPAFQIQYRGPSGAHGTLNGVRAGDLTSTVLSRIASKVGWSQATAAKLRLLKGGRPLDANAHCGLSKGDTVHVVARLDGGAPTLRPRGKIEPASGSALSDAPSDEGADYSEHLCHKDGEAIDGVEGLASEDQAVVTEWSAPPFQIFYRDVNGHHGTLDGVRSTDTACSVLRRIAIKLGLDDARMMVQLRLIAGGKQLEPAVACGLAKGETVHVVGRIEGGAPTLRSRHVQPASGAALPNAPSVTFYQGDRHGGSRTAECSWFAWMHPDRGAFADAWVSAAERRAMPAHLGVILTFIDMSGRWIATTVATESATQPGEWGYYSARHLPGGEYIGAMLDVGEVSGPSRFLVQMRSGMCDGARCRPGGPRCANDPRGADLPPNARLYDHGWLAVAPFAELNALRPGLSRQQRRKLEILFRYGRKYWQQHERDRASLPPLVPRTKQTVRRRKGVVAPRRRCAFSGLPKPPAVPHPPPVRLPPPSEGGGLHATALELGHAANGCGSREPFAQTARTKKKWVLKWRYNRRTNENGILIKWGSRIAVCVPTLPPVPPSLPPPSPSLPPPPPPSLSPQDEATGLWPRKVWRWRGVALRLRGAGVDEEGLSAYELMRLARIRENNAALAALGIVPFASKHNARMAVAQRKRHRVAEASLLPSRSSTRLAALPRPNYVEQPAVRPRVHASSSATSVPKPPGRPPRGADGASCTWDGQVGCWRERDGSQRPTSRTADVWRYRKRRVDTSLRLQGGGNLAEGMTTSAAAVNCRNADTLARLHPFPNDPNLLFDEASHTYTVFGAVPERSCTSLIAAFFAGFDPRAITDKCLERWHSDPSSPYYPQIQSVLEGGGSEADAAACIRDEWAERGSEASQLGTALHRYCEFELNGTPIAPPPELEAEVKQYHAWRHSTVVLEYELRAVRTELTVAWRVGERVVCAGQIDALFADKYGYYYVRMPQL